MFIKKGLGEDFWINLVMTLLFYIPGILHALLVCDLVPMLLCGAPAKLAIEIVLIFICPPAAVLLKKKFSWEFLIALILTFIMWFPGVLYALYVFGFLKCGRSVIPGR